MRSANDARFAGDLRTAIMRELPVTITYFKDGVNPETDTPVVRTIEPYDVIKSQSGNHLIKAMDRLRIKPRSFRTDRVVSYTVHRGGRRIVPVPVPAAPLPASRPVRALPDPQDDLISSWGDWLELTYDPDMPRYDTLSERDGEGS